MFLLPSLIAGLVLALVLGGKPARILAVRLRAPWAVVTALGLQLVLFSRLGEHVPELARKPAHLTSYVLLVVFAIANRHVRALVPVLLGMLLNLLAIGANGGHMPLSRGAAAAAGLDLGAATNVSESAGRLTFLGDVFALPARLPVANAFSVGDILIGLGMVAFIVVVSVSDGENTPLSVGRLCDPLRVAAYRRLAAGRLVSQLGDWLTLAALVGWIYEQTRSTANVAVVMLVRLAPPILGGGVAGLVVDRLRKERLLVGVELGRGVAVSGALVGVLFDSRPLVFCALGLSGVLAAMSGAAVPALVPSLLPADLLSSANAGLGIAANGAMALGAGGGGLALASIGAPAALGADIATFALAASLYAGLRLVRRAEPEEAPEEGTPSGLRYLLRHRRLLLLVVSFAAATMATGLTNVTLPRFLDHAAGLGSGAYGFGLAALATGLALGQIVVGVSRVGAVAGRWIGAGLVVMSGLFLVLALGQHAPTALLVLGAIGFVDGTTDVLFDTVIQREADPRYYGAIFGFSSALMTTTMMTAVAVAPLVNEFLDSQRVITAAGGVLLVAGAIGLLSRRAPSRAAAQPSAAPLGSR